MTALLRKIETARDIRRTYENWPLWFLSRMGINFWAASTEIRVSGSKFLAPNNAESWGIADQVWRERVYTKHFPILDGYRVLDVGAHFGFFSVFAALQGRNVKVVAYEPSGSTFAILRDNLRLNNLDKGGATAFNFGLGDRSEERCFYKPKGHDASGTLYKASLVQQSGRITEELVRIEDAKKMWEVFDTYDFAKFDCEGAELPIIRSLGDDIRRLRRIVLEYHDDPEEIAGLLVSKGFSIIEIVPLRVAVQWNAFSHMGMLYANRSESGHQ